MLSECFDVVSIIKEIHPKISGNILFVLSMAFAMPIFAIVAVHICRQFLPPKIMGLREHNGNTVVEVSVHHYLVGDIVKFQVQTDGSRCYQKSKWSFQPVRLVSDVLSFSENRSQPLPVPLSESIMTFLAV